MADSLSRYQGMRDFKETPEPRGKVKKTKGLENMALVRLGRLSVQPVTAPEWETVRSLAGAKV